jgi:hypothetical protein
MRHMQAASIDAFGGAVRVLELAALGSPAPDEVVISSRAQTRPACSFERPETRRTSGLSRSGAGRDTVS